MNTNISSTLKMSKKGYRGIYCVSQMQDKSYYVHKEGFSHIPVFGSITKSFKQAKIKLAESCGVPVNELKFLKSN